LAEAVEGKNPDVTDHSEHNFHNVGTEQNLKTDGSQTVNLKHTSSLWR
jgi:hypothetical protein